MEWQPDPAQAAQPDLRSMMESLGVYSLFGIRFDALPFSAGDATAGSEMELQAAVAGRRQDVDLPRLIESSNFFANLRRRAASGEMKSKAAAQLERYLQQNDENLWENSCVRFPSRLLSPFARRVLGRDLQADRENPGGERQDRDRFLFEHDGEETVRIPVSYLLKLSLADVLGREASLPRSVRDGARVWMDHFLNDNTSPETDSFHIVSLRPETGMGKAAAREASKRFLLCQLLLMHANANLGLKDSGQEAVLFFSPHPPLRQKWLNDCISDAFYRDLFMNPCLSGWRHGEAKHEYMHLCHRVLSRSQLNAVAKLREAGIIANNLVVLPNPSNISLANNGVHVSLGSRILTSRFGDPSSPRQAAQEKHMGDLVIKVAEHFLPLFVGTYSADPYRFDFNDFHPERALGFLAHELDYTHLRMLWRRWQKKASIRVLGQPVTPFGPPWLDRLIALGFGLKGDFVPDFRIIDYLMALLCTDRSPALDGKLGNHDRLKRDLAEMGVFDARMSLYLFIKLRECRAMGFSGFEGRHYSLFETLMGDMAPAVDLQNLILALSFQYLAEGRIQHDMIPDDPSSESERRQIVFGAAIGLPTFFIRNDTGNRFLRGIVERTARIRHSRRYPGYIRVRHDEYRRALIRTLRVDAAALIEMMDLRETMADLSERVEYPAERGAAGRLTAAILDRCGARSPLDVAASEFNGAAERYYRGDLRRLHIREALDLLEEDLRDMETSPPEKGGPSLRQALSSATGGREAHRYLREARQSITEGVADADALKTLLRITIASLYHDVERNVDIVRGGCASVGRNASVY